jgi:hypothetical protein
MGAGNRSTPRWFSFDEARESALLVNGIHDNVTDMTWINRADPDLRIRERVAAWRAKLTRSVAEARPLLREILAGPLN